jgi:hypothetical protein
VIYLDGVFVNLNRLGFKLIVCEGNLFSIVHFHLNLYSFLESMFRYLIGVVVLSIVVSIILRRGFYWLHSQMTSTFTFIEVLVVCKCIIQSKLVFSFLSKLILALCPSCNFIFII